MKGIRDRKSDNKRRDSERIFFYFNQAMLFLMIQIAYPPTADTKGGGRSTRAHPRETIGQVTLSIVFHRWLMTDSKALISMCASV